MPNYNKIFILSKLCVNACPEANKRLNMNRHKMPETPAISIIRLKNQYQKLWSPKELLSIRNNMQSFAHNGGFFLTPPPPSQSSNGECSRKLGNIFISFQEASLLKRKQKGKLKPKKSRCDISRGAQESVIKTKCDTGLINFRN